MAKNKISSMLVFTIVTFLALGIVSGLYFFNIKKNEDYQNQLHFRELNSVANEVTSGYTQFVKISTVLLNIRATAEQNANIEEANNQSSANFVNEKSTVQSEIRSVSNRARESRALQNLITRDIEVTAFYKEINGTDFDSKTKAPAFLEKPSVAWSSNNETMFGQATIIKNESASEPVSIEPKMNVTLIPTSDLIPDQVLSFPLILLAGKDGSVKARKFFYENSTDTADLEFTSVSKILSALYNQQKEEGEGEKEALPTYSGTVDRTIGGIQYRIFIQPANINLATGVVDTHYLLGFVALNEFRLTNLSVNPSAGLWIMIVLIGLTATIPMLKIRFTAPKEHFTRTDINLFFTGCFLLVGLVSITITHQFFSDYLKSSTLLQSHNLFKNIQSDFETELTQVNQSLDKIFTQTPLLDKTASKNNSQSQECKVLKVKAHKSRGFAEGAQIVSENCINEALRYKLKLSMYDNVPVDAFAESGFRLNRAGVIPSLFPEGEVGDLLRQMGVGRVGASGIMPTKTSFVDQREAIQRLGSQTFNFTDFSLSHRDYYQRSINCDLWSDKQKYESNCNSDNNLFIQRIKNVSDGRLSTQFAFADFEKLESANSQENKVKSISIKLRTFFDRIMPKNYGYAVFDAEGQVLYHSNQERSLAENILVETNNNPSIDLLMNSVATKNDTVVFDAIYRNAKHQFVGGAIHDVVPWKLVVFYDLKDLESTSLWTFLLAIFLFVQILLILFFWSRLATNQDAWTRLIAFCPDRKRTYLNCGMFMFAGVILCLSSMGVIVDLSARLALWLGLMAFYIYTFNKSFGEATKRKHLWTHPMMPFSVLSVLFAFYFLVYVNADSFTFDNSISIGFTVFGILFFIISHVGFTKPELFAKKSEWLRNKLFASYHSPFRYTYRYVFYLSVFIWFFSMVPGVLIINAANQYLLKVQAFNQSIYIEQRENEHLAALHDYFTLVGAGDELVEQISNIDLADARSVLLNSGNLTWIKLKGQSEPAKTDKVELETPSLEKTETEAQTEVEKTSLHVDPLFNTLIQTQSFGGSLSEDLYQFAQLAQKDTLVEYNANGFFLAALQNKVLIIATLLIVFFLLTLLFVRRAIVHGIMGEHLADHPTKEKTAISISDFLNKQLSKQGARLQILQAEKDAIIDYITYQDQLLLLGKNAFDVASLAALREDEPELDIIKWLLELNETNSNIDTQNAHKILVLSNFEKLVSDKHLRSIARALIKELHDLSEISVILLCDVDILVQFNDCVDTNDEGVMYSLPVNESLAWSLFLRRYTNFTMWYGEAKDQLEDDPTAYQTFVYETQGWPELREMGESIKVTLLGEVASSDFENALNDTWKPAQIIQFFDEQCTAFYRYKWSLCNIAERLTLFQLAQGGIVNPANANTISSLVKRGYVYRDSGWFIVNESFKNFVLSAEPQERFQSWLHDAKNNTWKLIRIPIFVTILVLVALIVIATGQSIQSILATATAALGLVSLLMRNLTTFRGGGGTPINTDNS